MAKFESNYYRIENKVDSTPYAETAEFESNYYRIEIDDSLLRS